MLKSVCFPVAIGKAVWYTNVMWAKAEKLTNIRNAVASRLLNNVVTLATAALGLTITFRRDLTAGSNPIAHPWLLKASWCAFALVIIGGTISRWGDVVVLQKLIKSLKFDDGKTVLVARLPRICAVSYYAALVGFIAGALCLLAFGLFNF